VPGSLNDVETEYYGRLDQRPHKNGKGRALDGAFGVSVIRIWNPFDAAQDKLVQDPFGVAQSLP